MAVTLTSIRLDTKLADEVKKELGVKTRTEAVNLALREIAGNRRFKKVIKKYEGKLKFAGHDE
jgi:Arc/MetJ family transcription regulator